MLHGVVLLASLEGGRVVRWDGPDGAAIDVFRRARAMPPFDFLGDRGVAVTATTPVGLPSSAILGTGSGVAIDACSAWPGAGKA